MEVVRDEKRGGVPAHSPTAAPTAAAAARFARALPAGCSRKTSRKTSRCLLGVRAVDRTLLESLGVFDQALEDCHGFSPLATMLAGDGIKRGRLYY